MSTEIYYFSGTGNSLAVARDIAANTQGTLIPVTAVINQEQIHTDADMIGIVFPIYDFKPPKIIEKFVRKLDNIGSKYLFAVCTYGISPGKTIKTLDNMIRSCGGQLSAGFAVHMPHNGIGSEAFSRDQHQNMFDNWKKKLAVIDEHIHAGKKGTLETSNLFVSLVLSGLFIKVIPKLLPLFKHVMTKGWDSLTFIADEKCDGCGICQKICPVNNIEMLDNTPSWSDHCEGCFACLHWCPQVAIQIGRITVNMPRYHHPDVKIADLIRAKS